MNQLILFQENLPKVFLVTIMVIILLIIVFREVFSSIEFFWVQYISSKPFYNHLYFRKNKLSSDQAYILESEFSFYQKLNKKQKGYFSHRVSKYIQSHQFTGKSGVYINDRKRVLISATAIMLTFGYRDYNINTVKKFYIYPKVYYSKLNKTLHKGEFNPRYRLIVFSWEDFLYGYNVDNDNFNLAIHEFVHAMHFEYMKPNNTSISALIFMMHYNKLKKFLNKNSNYRDRLVASKYLRNYAFTNNFEFIAVLIESFFETPLELKTQFPEIYKNVKKMLNFNFSQY